MNSAQIPMRSGYSARTTADEIVKLVDLSGKTVVITGGSAGLGLETSKALAKAGAKVIVPARDITKASNAVKDIHGVELYPGEMDLSKRETIEAFADWVGRNNDKLDILVNGAGIMAIPLARDSRGNEMQISTNYLGHYDLTRALLPLLRNARGARIVNLSSRAHWYGAVNFEDPNYLVTDYDKWGAYGQAKTAVSLFTVALDELYKQDGIRAYTVHPGSIVTGLSDFLTDDELVAFGAINANGDRAYESYDDERKTIQEGSATIVWCAASPQLADVGGVYCENCDIAPIAEDDGAASGVKKWAVDKDIAMELWEETPRLFR